MKKIFILFALFAFINNTTQAENLTEKVSANKNNLIGAWHVVTFLPGSFGQQYSDSDYLAPSQIYGFYDDGHMRSLVSDQAKAYTQDRFELESHFTNKPAKLHYQFLDDQHIAITIDEKGDIGTVWKTHIVDEDETFNGIPLQKGDMLMGMTAPKSDKTDKLRYIRVMRKNK
ncbi:MAG: hypothetical protein ACI9TY_001111 [Alphaproteobacteria bacterium]|jgi:hypothetical protein